jgi:hypothetical protein
MIDPFDRPKRKPIEFDAGDTVILCEGFDECVVLRKLCTDWTQAPKIGICGEGLNWADEIKGLADQVKMRCVAVIGLVFDAEKDRAARIDEIKSWLQEAGFTPPQTALRPKKCSLDGVLVRTAYLINPHGKGRGAIETYFLPQIRRAEHWPCIEQLLQCYDERNPSSVLKEKLIVRTFIAHMNGRNTGLNAAFNAKILNCDDRNFDPVRRFLSLLRDASPVERDRQRPCNTGNR